MCGLCFSDDKGFSVNPSSGVITSTRQFDHEEQYVYNITVLATDIVGHQVYKHIALTT